MSPTGTVRQDVEQMLERMHSLVGMGQADRARLRRLGERVIESGDEIAAQLLQRLESLWKEDEPMARQAAEIERQRVGLQTRIRSVEAAVETLLSGRAAAAPRRAAAPGPRAGGRRGRPAGSRTELIREVIRQMGGRARVQDVVRALIERGVLKESRSSYNATAVALARDAELERESRGVYRLKS